MPNAERNKHFGYRPDIDGLRAFAVLSVVLFHLGFERLEGGFLGVDIFFVISGYLISSIIEPKISIGSFSFRTFYLKRIRRLIPPSLVTIIATFVASAFILQPNDMIGFSRSAIAATFSVSNILFFTEAGYWDVVSELKPLLHTWSLGVEEQFYLFWPLLIYMLSLWLGRGSRSINWVIVFGLISVAGLAVSHYMLQWQAAAAFYLLPARVFEFSIGAFFAFVGRSQKWQAFSGGVLSMFLGVVGLAGLCAFIMVYDGATLFPGLNGLLPCLLTGFVLLAGAEAGQRRGVVALLSMSPVVWLGKISYSLYLVHWPVVSLMRYKVGLNLSPTHQLFAALLMLILTLILYYGVERTLSARAGQGKTTKRQFTRNGFFAIKTGAAAVLASVIFAHSAMNDGWTWRFPAIVVTPSMISAASGGRLNSGDNDCLFINFPEGQNCDPERSVRVLVIGDSHEREGANILRAAFGDSPELEIIRFDNMFSCNLSKREGDSAKAKDEYCRARNAKLIETDILEEIDTIFYSANQPFEPIEKFTLEMLRKSKKINPELKIITIGSYVVTKKSCPQLINETGRFDACVSPQNVAKWAGTDKDQMLFKDFTELSDLMIDRMELLCTGATSDTCVSQGKDGGLAIFDTNHMSIGFTDLTADRLRRRYPDLVHWMDIQSDN